MALDSYVTVLNLLMVMLSNGASYGGLITEDEDLQRSLIGRLDDIQHQLLEAANSMRAVDSDISKALADCLVEDSPICDALGGEFKNLMGLGSQLTSDKMSASDDPQLDRYRRLFHELGRKRAMVNHLLGVVRGANNVLKNERKRTCNLNLGFHCQTEEISNFADMYDYLSSAKSPGKKRSARSAH